MSLAYLPPSELSPQINIFTVNTMFNGHADALRSSPPEIFVTPPSPEVCSTIDMDQVSAPILIIPGHDPIITTLTSGQMIDLFPTVHIHFDHRYPAVALLPAASVSYKGLVYALRWREADISQGHGTKRNLTECIEIYQALAFLGNRQDSEVLQPLGNIILAEIEQGLIFEDVQGIWRLRHYPFTERFITSMLRELVDEYDDMSEEEISFHGRTSADAEIEKMAAEAAAIFEWLGKENELRERFKCVQERMRLSEVQAKRDRRKAVVLGVDSSQSQVPVILYPARHSHARRVQPRLVNTLE